MATFTKVNPGDPIQAHQLNQVIDALIGTASAGVALAVTAVNDATNYALTVQNDEAGNSRALNVLKSDGTNLIRADASGVTLGSPLNLPTGSITSAYILDGTVQNVDLGPDVARANLLTNGGFEIWQRGSGPFTTGAGIGTADRWFIWAAGTDTFSVSRDTTNMDTGSRTCMSVTFTKGSGTNSTVSEDLKATDGYQFSGSVALSMRVRSSTANAVRLRLSDSGGGSQYSSYHTGSGTYQTLTVVLAPTAGAATVTAGVIFDASCTAYVDNAMLVIGTQPANYVPVHPSDDMARALRYYEISTISVRFSIPNSSTFEAVVPMKAVKAVTPTVTITPGTRSNLAGGSPSSYFVDVNSVVYRYTPNTSNTDTYALADKYVFEANP